MIDLNIRILKHFLHFERLLLKALKGEEHGNEISWSQSTVIILRIGDRI